MQIIPDVDVQHLNKEKQNYEEDLRGIEEEIGVYQVDLRRLRKRAAKVGGEDHLNSGEYHELKKALQDSPWRPLKWRLKK